MRQLIPVPRNMKMPGEHDTLLELENPPAEFLERAKVKYTETPEFVKNNVDQLRKLVTDEKSLQVRTDDAFLIRFLRARRHNVDSAFKLVKNYSEFKVKNSEYYKEIDREKMKKVVEGEVVQVVTNRDNLGRRIIIQRIGLWDPYEISADDMLHAAMLSIEIGMMEPKTQVAGAVAIMDMEGFGFSHVRNVTPAFAKRMIQLLAECFPVRIHAIHIVNEPVVFAMAYAIFKNFLNERMTERIFCHGSDWESLHDHIDPEYLPEEYGGTFTEQDNTRWVKIMELDIVREELLSLGYVEVEPKPDSDSEED